MAVIRLIQIISVKQDMFLERASGSVFSGIDDLKTFPRIWNPYAFENPNVQKFIHSTGLHFDLVINEEFFGDSFLMFAHKFKAPIVTICKYFELLNYCESFESRFFFIHIGSQVHLVRQNLLIASKDC